MRRVRSQRRGGGSTAEELAVMRDGQGKIIYHASHSRTAALGRANRIT